MPFAMGITLKFYLRYNLTKEKDYLINLLT